MFAIEYGLGRFGDRRLEKGGPCCTLASFKGRVRAFDASEEHGRGKSRSRGCFAILR